MKITIDIPDEVVESGAYCAYFGAWSEKLQETIKNGMAMTSEEVRIAVEKQKPKCPITRIVDVVGVQKRCPTCNSLLYDNDWDHATSRKTFTQCCIYCGQRFTKKGRYIGQWEEEDADSN